MKSPTRSPNTLKKIKEIRDRYDDKSFPLLSQRIRSVLNHGDMKNLLPAYQEAAIQMVEEDELERAQALSPKDREY